MENESILNFSSLINNKNILSCLLRMKKYQNNSNSLEGIKNKFWNLFLHSDGSMTKNMKFIFPELKFKLITNRQIETSNTSNLEFNTSDSEDSRISQEILFNLNKFVEFSHITSDKIVERKILFYTDNHNDHTEIDGLDIKMIGLSFWNEEFYQQLYTDKCDENKPIGLIMIEKEIEFFKTIKSFIFNFENENLFIFRITIFKVHKKTAFVLIEIFDYQKLKEILGELK
jgi:hypothetical protein